MSFLPAKNSLRNSLWLAHALSVFLLASTTFAQNTIEQVPVQDDVNGVDADNPLAGLPNAPTIEIIDNYLKQDVFIAPGRGLKRVFLGLPLKEVLARWGQPNEVRKRGAFGRTQDWVYRDSDNTVLVVSGKSEVNELRIVGDLGSKYQTTRGVQFGMARFQIAGIYGRGDYDAKDKLLKYEKLGMEMEFAGGGLAGIKVVRVK